MEFNLHAETGGEGAVSGHLLQALPDLHQLGVVGIPWLWDQLRAIDQLTTSDGSIRCHFERGTKVFTGKWL